VERNDHPGGAFAEHAAPPACSGADDESEYIGTELAKYGTVQE
jgi:hypothetical protein